MATSFAGLEQIAVAVARAESPDVSALSSGEQVYVALTANDAALLAKLD